MQKSLRKITQMSLGSLKLFCVVSDLVVLELHFRQRLLVIVDSQLLATREHAHRRVTQHGAQDRRRQQRTCADNNRWYCCTE